MMNAVTQQHCKAMKNVDQKHKRQSLDNRFYIL